MNSPTDYPYPPDAETIPEAEDIKSPSSDSRGSQASASRPRPVGFIEGSKATLSDETRDLLRKRLRAFAVVILVAKLLITVAEAIKPALPFGRLHLVTVAIVVASYILLRSRVALSLRALRLFEAMVIGLPALHIMMAMGEGIRIFVDRGDVASAIAVKMLMTGAASMVIVIYGILIPHAWKRATLILIPASCLPLII